MKRKDSNQDSQNSEEGFHSRFSMMIIASCLVMSSDKGIERKLEKHELPEYKDLDTWGLCSNFFSNTSGKLLLNSRTVPFVHGSHFFPLEGA